MKKNFWKSKTFWGSVLIAGGFIGQYLTGNINLEVAITGVGTALGLFGIRGGLA